MNDSNPVEMPVEPPALSANAPHTPPWLLKRTIVGRVFNHNKTRFWFILASGERLNPETAIRHQLVDEAKLRQAMQEESIAPWF